MIKVCKVCNKTIDFGSNVNATTCKDCLTNGLKFCSQCGEIKQVSEFKKAGKNASGEIRYNGECKCCTKKRQAVYYVDNDERIKKRTNEYRKSNLANYVAYSNKYKANNQEARRIQTAKASKRYSQTPHGAMTIKRHNERYNRAAIIGDLKATEWQAILEFFDFKCAYCNSTVKLSMEHIVPVSKGGRLTKSNIIVACQHCNSSRGNNDFSKWLDKVPETNRANIKRYINEGHKSIE